jgi:hypothetical protein
MPIIVAAWSKAWNIFSRLSIGIMGSNPTRGMYVCVYSVFVLGSGLSTGWLPIQGVLPTVGNWNVKKETILNKKSEILKIIHVL